MTSFMDLHSLRWKITSAYIALVIATSLLGVIAFLDLHYLENRISDGETVSRFKDAVFDMRREEKNLFLYIDEDAYRRTDEHAAATLAILADHRESILPLLGAGENASLEARIHDYRQMLKRWIDDLGERVRLQCELNTRGQ